jgi:cytochrome c556
MKNVSLALTLGLLLISSAIFVSIPRNIFAQQQDEDTDYTMTEDQIKAKITEFKTKHPKFAAIVEQIPTLDLKETVKGYLAAGAVQKMLKYHAKNLVEEKVANVTGSSSSGGGSSPMDQAMTDEQIQAKVTDFKAKHPKFAAVVEGISNLDLKETVKGYLGAEVLQKLLAFHAKNLVEEKVAAATSGTPNQ